MKPLGRNQGRYHGEGIDIAATLEGVDASLTARGWRRELLYTKAGVDCHAYRRDPANALKRVYISTGIHADEPAGPAAISVLAETDQWPDSIDISLIPCLNPSGFPLNQRENAEGVDLNRDYRALSTEEVRSHVAWIQRQNPYDLTICLHEDWESDGYYIYEVNPDGRPSIADQIIAAAAQVIPIQTDGKVDDFEAKDGIIRPKFNPEERPLWPEALYLTVHKTRQSYTLEAPSDYPLPARVAAHVAAVRRMLELV